MKKVKGKKAGFGKIAINNFGNYYLFLKYVFMGLPLMPIC
jgi:hypothetical protein